MFRKLLVLLYLFTIVAAIVIVPLGLRPPRLRAGPQWCAGKTIRFFVGGAEGDAFRLDCIARRAGG